MRPISAAACSTTWSGVWTRAVLVPAGRRASTAWLGCAIVAGLLGMHPRDVTGLALHHAGVAAVLAITWLLIFVPVARVIVRADAATYLRSLPAPRFVPRVLAGLALVGLQLPWLALWTIGAGLRGAVIVAALTVPIVALAAWRPSARRRGWPGWRSSLGALSAIHVRALRRRAGDALVRACGLAVLAGATAGLFVRNNQLVDGGAAVMGASVIAIVGVPAHVGPLLVLVESHRATGWLAASLGIPAGTRATALLAATALVQLAAAALAVAAAAIVADATATTLVHLAGTALAIAGGTALGVTRVLLGTDALAGVATRAVGGAIGVAALAVVCLGMLGAAAGSLAFLATTTLALLAARPAGGDAEGLR